MQIDLRAFMNIVARQRRQDPGFRNAVDGCDDIKSDFVAGWAAGGAANRFGTVREFCGSLASVFPKTATVESDLSVI